MEEEGSYFQGYAWEGGPIAAQEMIRAHTSRTCVQYCWKNWVSARVAEGMFSEFDALTDQFSFECFYVDDVSHVAADADYAQIHSSHDITLCTTFGTGSHYWNQDSSPNRR